MSIPAANLIDLVVFPGLVAPVARVGHLVALKLLARDDEERGFARGRDLGALLDAWLSDA